MKATLLAALAVCACACSSTDDRVEPTVTVGDVAVGPPAGWQVQELGPNARIWAPADNKRKETITVIVGHPVSGDPGRTLAATRGAFGLLHDVHLTSEAALTTASGLSGRRFDLTFRPDTAM